MREIVSEGLQLHIDLARRILKAVLRKFHFLHALSFQLTASPSCVQYRTQTEEVLCASFRRGYTELIEMIQE